MPLRSIALPLALMLSVAPALAQVASPTPAPAIPTEPRETIEGTLSQDRTVIAVPAFATPAVTTVAGLRTDNLGRQIADVIAAALEATVPPRNTTVLMNNINTSARRQTRGNWPNTGSPAIACAAVTRTYTAMIPTSTGSRMVCPTFKSQPIMIVSASAQVIVISL